MEEFDRFLNRKLPEGILPFDWDSLPLETKGKVLPHQRNAVDMAIETHGSRTLIAAGMGFGKSLIGSFFFHHHCHGTRLLLVMAAQVNSWIREIAKWTTVECDVYKKGCVIGNKVIVFSIDSAKNNTDILSERWDCIVVDECHLLKGDSIRSRKIIPILQKSSALMMLSGTPQESRTNELFNCLQCLHPTYFKCRKTFTACFSRGQYNKWGAWEETGNTNLEYLNGLLSTCMFRITKLETPLPPKKRKLVYLKPTPEMEHELYELKQMQMALQQMCLLQIRQSR